MPCGISNSRRRCAREKEFFERLPSEGEGLLFRRWLRWYRALRMRCREKDALRRWVRRG
ncbi:hypothetical protein GMOD_00004263 [Pyrenophora seminiperda CCB06]|uniref:Uncharacterized protein n=1 Tax=Pyrenophora seminiperda CCB06 TaxID=1302712 RepID=A0A3M7M0V2_9PLEO|nr:hypothetical protein GMOD_00004263 [Pyrenophora seminiperda CCB06]